MNRSERPAGFWGGDLMRRIPDNLVRNGVLEVLRMSGEPAATRDLVTAVYFFTGDVRVGYGNVTFALRALAADNEVERCVDGTWQAVTR